MAAGDEGAVGTFYRRYFEWMYAQARNATHRDEAFCLDVVQEAVLRVIRSIKSVESEATLLAWLKLVVQSTAFNLLRQEKRRHRQELIAVSAALPPAPAAADDLSDDEQLAWLRGEIARLDPQLVDIIEMRYHRGWTLRQIGDRLGLSTGTIDGRLRSAIRTLRHRMKDT